MSAHYKTHRGHFFSDQLNLICLKKNRQCPDFPANSSGEVSSVLMDVPCKRGQDICI